MEKLIKSLTLALDAIKEYLSKDEEKLSVRKRLNSLLRDGNFGARFNKCRFKKVNIPFIDVKGLICKELKTIVLYDTKLNKEQERVCRARRFNVIYVDNKYAVKQLEKELVNNELI